MIQLTSKIFWCYYSLLLTICKLTSSTFCGTLILATFAWVLQHTFFTVTTARWVQVTNHTLSVSQHVLYACACGWIFLYLYRFRTKSCMSSFLQSTACLLHGGFIAFSMKYLLCARSTHRMFIYLRNFWYELPKSSALSTTGKRGKNKIVTINFRHLKVKDVFFSPGKKTSWVLSVLWQNYKSESKSCGECRGRGISPFKSRAAFTSRETF